MSEVAHARSDLQETDLQETDGQETDLQEGMQDYVYTLCFANRSVNASPSNACILMF